MKQFRKAKRWLYFLWIEVGKHELNFEGKYSLARGA
jgi:hypothetical protein